MSDDPSQAQPSGDGNPLQAVGGIVRIGFSAWQHTTLWAVGITYRGGSRVVRAAVSGESPADLAGELRDYVRGALGVEELVRGVASRATSDAAPRPAATPAAEPAVNGTRAASVEALRRRGAELLRASADVHVEEDAHPAYARILEELAPDEGRILRLLALEGAQPSVDVKTSRPLNVGSHTIAPGLSMIGAEAGCRYMDRVPAMLNNLYRLGLVWFSREPVRDHMRYQVLEAQPDVAAAVRRAGRGKIVRRSIELTPFGKDFCDVCLPIHSSELEALPGATPPA